MFKIKKNIVWILSFCLLSLSIILSQLKSNFLFSTLDINRLQSEVQAVLNASDAEQTMLLESNDLWHLQKDLNNKQEYVLMRNDSVLFWTSNKIDFERIQNIHTPGIYRLASRIYFLSIKKHQNKTLYCLLLLKKDFEFENSFLENSSSSLLHLPHNYLPTNDNTENSFSVSLGNENVFLNFERTSDDQLQDVWKWLVFSMFFIGVLLFWLFVSQWFKNQIRIHLVLRSLITLVIFVLFRLFLLNTSIIPFAMDFELFMPFDFANNWIASLGMLLVDIVWLSATLLVIHGFWKAKDWTLKWSHSLLLQAIMLGLFFIASLAVQNIITNSTSNFINFDGVIMRYQDILLLLLLGILFLTLVRFLSLIIKRTNAIELKSLTIYFIALYLPIAIAIFLLEWQWIYVLVLHLLVIALVVLRQKEHINAQAYKLIMVLLVSLFVVLILQNYSFDKELDNRSLYLDNYQTENDRLAEYLLNELDEKLVKDSTLLGLIYQLPESEEKVYSYIKRQHLTGYWSQYQSDITICGSSSEFKESNNISSCEAFFSDKINESSKRIGNSHFMTIQDFGIDHYLATYHFLVERDSSLIDLYVFLKPKEQHKNLGYPSILVSREIDKESDERFYSYAKYVSNRLVSHKGQYNYALDYNFSKEQKGRFTVLDGEYTHLIDHQAEHTYNIITAKNQTLWDFFIVLSYVFILYIVALYISEFLIQLVPFRLTFKFTLKDKLRMSFIGVLLLTFIVLAIAIIVRSTSLSEQKQEYVLEEKMESVLVELKHKLSNEEDVESFDSNYLNYLLIKFSNVFFTDINLFDLDGRLLASSRPEVFERGLIGSRMNPSAYYNIHHEKRSKYIHHEGIGKQDYLSAYIPFKDVHNSSVAYLSLPYFAKDKEIKADITKLITAFLNLFVLLFIVTGVFTVFISNRITSPLSFIQQKLKEFRLEQKNEAIQYHSKDEIGALVDEYNRTVEELNKNMALLAQKEREGAWKEMAKQIAHEIKNPLTPMKLSLQHLKYIWKDDRDDKEEKMYATIDLVVKQIDQLAEIASSFSDFSKMTIAQQEEFDLELLIKEQVSLYSTKAQIKVESLPDMGARVFADEKQIVRVVQNILSNAIQAVPEDRDAELSIKISVSETSVMVDFCDNGLGMDTDTQKHLFEPNFTTKTSGMGLGLAIVKQIMENNLGEISFTTEINKGTCFMLKLPKSK